MSRPLGSTTAFNIGDKFGQSTILEILRKETRINHYVKPYAYVMQCDCGNVFEIFQATLSLMMHHTNIITCGCVSTNGHNRSGKEYKFKRDLDRIGAQTELKHMLGTRYDQRDKWLLEILKAWKEEEGKINDKENAI